MKTPDGKAKWRTFCMTYEHKLKEFNTGTLIRTRAAEPFGEQNSFLGIVVVSLAFSYS